MCKFDLTGSITKAYPSSDGKLVKLTIKPELPEGFGPRKDDEKVAQLDIWADAKLATGLALMARVRMTGYFYLGSRKALTKEGRAFFPKDLRMKATELVDLATAEVRKTG